MENTRTSSAPAWILKVPSRSEMGPGLVDSTWMCTPAKGRPSASETVPDTVACGGSPMSQEYARSTRPVENNKKMIMNRGIPPLLFGDFFIILIGLIIWQMSIQPPPGTAQSLRRVFSVSMAQWDHGIGSKAILSRPFWGLEKDSRMLVGQCYVMWSVTTKVLLDSRAILCSDGPNNLVYGTSHDFSLRF